MTQEEKLLQALGHPLRLEIMEVLLTEGPVCQQDLVEREFEKGKGGSDQPRVNYQVSFLVKAGLIRKERVDGHRKLLHPKDIGPLMEVLMKRSESNE